jgi:hypothetical protein
MIIIIIYELFDGYLKLGALVDEPFSLATFTPVIVSITSRSRHAKKSG